MIKETTEYNKKFLLVTEHPSNRILFQNYPISQHLKFEEYLL